jgi:hypothetical protein
MPNDSSTGGYLSPVAPSSALFDAALDALLQQAVVGITGLAGSLVRPRWQPVVPKQPEPSINWCAIGVTEIDPMDYPAEIHDGAGNGSDQQQAWEEFAVLASFYGPDGMANAALLRRGLYVAQNRELLQAQGIDLVEAGKVVTAPDLVNQQWVQRRDIPIRLRRQVVTVYPILNILSADDTLVTDTH